MTHEQKHAQIAATLRNYSYIYFMQGDSHNGAETMACACTPEDVVHFLLILEEGAVLGCNGREPSAKHATPPQSWWDSPLGRPLGPPVTSAGVVSRKFESGAVARYDLRAKKASVVGWEPAAAFSPATAAAKSDDDTLATTLRAVDAELRSLRVATDRAEAQGHAVYLERASLSCIVLFAAIIVFLVIVGRYFTTLAEQPRLELMIGVDEAPRTRGELYGAYARSKALPPPLFSEHDGPRRGRRCRSRLDLPPLRFPTLEDALESERA